MSETTEPTETMELDFQPYGNYLLVVPDDAESVTGGGIYLPQQAQEKPCLATVIRVGLGQRYNPEHPEIPCYSKVGDRVLVAKHAIQAFKTPDGKGGHNILSIISEGDVYGRFGLEPEGTEH